MDISLSAHANARRWYELKKKQESKQEKTIIAHEKAFKAAERKTRLQLSQVALRWWYFPAASCSADSIPFIVFLVYKWA